MHDLVSTGARTIDDLSPLVDKSSAHPALLDQWKQAGFYTDFLLEKLWSNPSLAINKQVAETVLTRAKALLSKRVYTQREVALWTKHLTPVAHLDMEAMKRAVLDWHQEMIAEGLSDDSVESWEGFLFGSVVLNHQQR